MKTMRAMVALVACAIPLVTTGGAGAQESADTVVALHLDGVVDPFTADYVTSNIEQAESEGVAAVLLTIDTPGGLDSSMRDIVTTILNSEVPVLCMVAPPGARAASAGTFILLSCSVAAMAPGTNVGAAHPVGVSGVILQEKVLNDAVAYIRSIAEARGRDPDWAESAVRDSESVSAEEALDIGAIDLIEEDIASLLDAVDGMEVQVGAGDTAVLSTAGATVDERGQGWLAGILHSLLTPDLAFIFFFAGLALIVVEFLAPGFGVAGILGALALIGAFVSFGMLPVQLIGIVLLVTAAVFYLLELKFPGVGVPTVGGTVALVLGGLLLFDSDVPNVTVSLWVILPVAAAAVGFFAFVVSAAMRTRKLRPATPDQRLLGLEGVVTTTLAPSGVVLIASEQWSAVSTAGAVPVGSRIRVVGVDGLRVRVEPVENRPEDGFPVAPGRGGVDRP